MRRTPAEEGGHGGLWTLIAVLSFAIVFLAVSSWTNASTGTVTAVLAAVPFVLRAAFTGRASRGPNTTDPNTKDRDAKDRGNNNRNGGDREVEDGGASKRA